MKAHTNQFKTNIKTLGREIDSKITYTLNGEDIELGPEDLNSVSPHYEGSILKSVMKQLDLDSNTDIPLGTEINYQFGLKVGNSFEYLDFGNYIVYSSEKQEDTHSWKIVCYDKMLYSMKDYNGIDGTFPMTLNEYAIAISEDIGLTFASDVFANSDRILSADPYVDSDGNNLGYTYRDIYDEIAGASGSTICIDNNDNIEVRYISTVGSTTQVSGTSLYLANAVRQRIGEPSFGGTEGTLLKQLNDLNNGYLYDGVNNISQTNNDLPFNIDLTYINSTNVDGIDEEYLKDINVNFGEKYGPINSIVLSRSAGADNVYLRDENSVSQNGLCEIKINDNQIMNGNDRSDYLPELLGALNGLEYYINDFSSTGITYYELCDMYSITVDGNTYNCVMFNDEINITQGVEELIHTDMPDESETDYTKADKTDRRINRTTLEVDKQNGIIESYTGQISSIQATAENAMDGVGEINRNLANYYTVEQVNTLVQTASSGITNTFQTSGGANIFRNTGLWFATNDSDNPYEFWSGKVVKATEYNATNRSALILQNDTLEQQEEVSNGRYTISFKYQKLIGVADVSVFINDTEYELTSTTEAEFELPLDVSSQYINIKFVSDTDNSCKIYDLMVNYGSKMAYSQNQNETTTDTVNISKGITITSSDTNTRFKADSDGTRIFNTETNEIKSEFTDKGMKTDELEANKATIANLLIQDVDDQTWLSRI